MRKCKYCRSEIDKEANVCPNCHKSQRTPTWVIVLIVIFVIGGIGAIASSSDDEKGVESNSTSSKSTQEKIEYIKVTRDDMREELKSNAAAAKEKYINKYVEVSGKLGTIDSDLKYISLVSSTDDWDIAGMMCYIKSDEQKNIVKSLTKDQEIIVKGKITDVGEVLGYSLNITEIKAN